VNDSSRAAATSRRMSATPPRLARWRSASLSRRVFRMGQRIGHLLA
jgi:hypothetical protein